MEATLQGMLEMGLGQLEAQSSAGQDSDDDGIAFGGISFHYIKYQNTNRQRLR